MDSGNTQIIVQSDLIIHHKLMHQNFILIFILTLLALRMQSQNVIKIRSGLCGMDIPIFNSRNLTGEIDVLNTSYHTRKIEKVKPWFDFHAFLEFEKNQKFSISLGYVNAGISSGIRYSYIPEISYYISPDGYKYPEGYMESDVYVSYDIHKFPLTFSYRLFDNRELCKQIKPKRLFLEPDITGGFSLMLMDKKMQVNKFVEIPFFYDEFTDYKDDHVQMRYYRNALKSTGVGLIAGMNIRLRNQNHEFCTVTAYYEQGLIWLLQLYQEGTINNEFRYNNSTVSRGSSFSVRLTFPVFTYNFTKKKFYRD